LNPNSDARPIFESIVHRWSLIGRQQFAHCIPDQFRRAIARLLDDLAANSSPIETLRTEITAVAAQATGADMELVDQIIARARASKRDVAIYTVSPAAMAR
jgi:hypothetical protein